MKPSFTLCGASETPLHPWASGPLYTPWCVIPFTPHGASEPHLHPVVVWIPLYTPWCVWTPLYTPCSEEPGRFSRASSCWGRVTKLAIYGGPREILLMRFIISSGEYLRDTRPKTRNIVLYDRPPSTVHNRRCGLPWQRVLGGKKSSLYTAGSRLLGHHYP
ncbi:hypothetical protein J6590_103721 [Homalodisca vitripennis]|nr:hypothetical protein J6590_103721 [Homalodisca vitripennis]